MNRLIKYALSASIVLSSLLTSGCSERLSSSSVVEQNFQNRPKTELDLWIEQNLTIPYGISVEYRWNHNNATLSGNSFPASEGKVKEVLQVFTKLGLGVFEHESTGGKRFMQRHSPIKLYLYGGEALDGIGLPKISNPQGTGLEMVLYDVNSFDKTNPDKVFILLKSIYFQVARILSITYHFDYDALNMLRQQSSQSVSQGDFFKNDDLKFHIGDLRKRREGMSDAEFRKRWMSQYRPYEYPLRRGCFTLHGLQSAECDFCDIVSTYLTSTAHELNTQKGIAAKPLYDVDPSGQEKYNAIAKYYADLLKKKETMVMDFFSKKLQINIQEMQVISLQMYRSYTGSIPQE